MTDCHSFAFWFMRPLAEFLGGLALFAILMAGVALAAGAWVAWDIVVQWRHSKRVSAEKLS